MVKARGEAMQKTADTLREASGGDASGSGASTAPGMAAVIGLAPEQVEELIAKWGAQGLKDVYPGNINSPKQLAVSGTAAALTEAEAKFKEAGAKRVIRLQVAAPFHSPLMADSAEAFRPVLEGVTFNDPVIPLFSNVTGKQVSSGEEAKKLALVQITSPVRWVDEEAAIAALGAEALLEVGPGKVLQGLWRDACAVNGSAIPCFLAGNAEDISKVGITN
jgi:[acyl-carrier-protein] S-malonyltransferase